MINATTLRRPSLYLFVVLFATTLGGCVQMEPGIIGAQFHADAVNPAAGELAVGSQTFEPILMPGQRTLDTLVYGPVELDTASK